MPRVDEVRQQVVDVWLVLFLGDVVVVTGGDCCIGDPRLVVRLLVTIVLEHSTCVMSVNLTRYRMRDAVKQVEYDNLLSQ